MHAQSGLLVRPKAVVNAATAYDVDLILAARAPNDGDLLMLNDNRMLVQNRFKLAARPKGGERQNAGDYFEVVLSFNRAQPSPGSEFFFVPRYEEGVVSIAAVHIAWAAVRIAAAGWPRGILLEHVEYLRNALVRTYPAVSNTQTKTPQNRDKDQTAHCARITVPWPVERSREGVCPLACRRGQDCSPCHQGRGASWFRITKETVKIFKKKIFFLGEHKDTVDSICSGIDQRQSSLLSFMYPHSN